jgi:hypothetical protein
MSAMTTPSEVTLRAVADRQLAPPLAYSREVFLQDIKLKYIDWKGLSVFRSAY